MHLKIRHRTEYRYETPVRYSIQELRLTPPTAMGQQIDKWKINRGMKLHKTKRGTYQNEGACFAPQDIYCGIEL